MPKKPTGEVARPTVKGDTQEKVHEIADREGKAPWLVYEEAVEMYYSSKNYNSVKA